MVVNQIKMEVSGKIKIIMDVKTFESGFTKREFVVTTSEDYPQDIKIELLKEKAAMLDSYKVGDSVTVGVNLRGSEWQGKYFVTLAGWKMNKVEVKATAPQAQGSDDLPF